MAAILKFYFRFRLRPSDHHWHIVLHRCAKFYANHHHLHSYQSVTLASMTLSVCLPTLTDKNITISNWDMVISTNQQWLAANILNVQRNTIFLPQRPVYDQCLSSIHKPIYEINISIGDWHMAKNPDQRWRQPPSWILLGLLDTRLWQYLHVSAQKLQLSSLATEIWSNIQIQHGGCHHLEFLKSGTLRRSLVILVWPTSIHTNLRQIPSLVTDIIGCKHKSKTVADSILDFQKKCNFKPTVSLIPYFL